MFLTWHYIAPRTNEETESPCLSFPFNGYFLGVQTVEEEEKNKEKTRIVSPRQRRKIPLCFFLCFFPSLVVALPPFPHSFLLSFHPRLYQGMERVLVAVTPVVPVS